MDSEGASESEPAGSERPESGPRSKSDRERERDGASPADLNNSAASESDLSSKPNPSREPRDEQSPNAPSPIPAGPNSPGWPDRLLVAGTSSYEWLSRPRVRLTVTGVLLLLMGGLVITSSVWTLPLVIVGVLMVVIAWIGSRLDGRFAVEWGETGTKLEFRAIIKTAQPAPAALTRTSLSTHNRVLTTKPEPEHPQIIDGEAHTVEIEVAELEALIAAVETTKADSAQVDPSVQATRNLRVAHGGGRSSEARR